jgi:hypothetical protein
MVDPVAMVFTLDSYLADIRDADPARQHTLALSPYFVTRFPKASAISSSP